MSRPAVGGTKVYYRESDEVAQNTWPGRGTQCECLETRNKHDELKRRMAWGIGYVECAIDERDVRGWLIGWYQKV